MQKEVFHIKERNSNMKQIKNVDELKEVCSGEGQGFFILLNFGLRSSKFISYDQSSKRFFVDNYIDEVNQELTSKQLYTRSNIGKAIQRGCFFKDN
jgi:hypothetical protein